MLPQMSYEPISCEDNDFTLEVGVNNDATTNFEKDSFFNGTSMVTLDCAPDQQQHYGHRLYF